MQKLTITSTIEIPESHVLITKTEFEDLQQQSLSGKYWSMKDLEQHTSKKSEWLKEKVLYPSHFKTILDIENEGFVYYPKKKGEPWAFHARKMALFLDENFHRIFSN